MRLKKLRICNIKSFPDSGEIEFSKGINVLLGPNNAGKSTILRSVFALQSQVEPWNVYFPANRRLGATSFSVSLTLSDFLSRFVSNAKPPEIILDFENHPGVNFHKRATNPDGTTVDPTLDFSATEPNNWIYPFLVGRKVIKYEEQINEERANAVLEPSNYLNSKIDRLCNYGFWAHKEYIAICERVFGFVVTCAQSKDGKRAGLSFHKLGTVPLTGMGEGAKNMLSLIADLCVTEGGNLFLIEEPENDVHPKALKAVLEFILSKAENNQFLISTHSNIVVKYFGSHADTKLFQLSLGFPQNLPTSEIRTIGGSADERLKVLEELGYELFDSDLWRGYIVFEESTAQGVARDALIPLFAPALSSVCTIAASGADDMEARVSDLLRLFTFLNTAPAYKGKAWAFADGDEAGQKAIARLKEKFTSWNPKHFQNFSAPNFEEYYPPRFKAQADAALAMPKGRVRQDAKGAVAKALIDWAKSEPELAKQEFATSAREVIALLQSVEREFIRTS